MSALSGRRIAGDHFVIYVRFTLKPGMREAYLALVKPVLEGIASDPLCKTIIVHTDDENPDDVVLYEIWAGTRERFMREETVKPYRADYARTLPSLLAKPAEAHWLRPTAEWYSAMLPTDGPA
ncbi:putative quinol monooxygenase [Sphingobium chlorophenolicum]|uniref:ABM domain-containing protein n=1 Tax=Sphingobium chlorophenolicum TaxID=46429 RepID=A0A081RA15_SPHCR|nr:antibiotic biosynthesis monooxygenase [Sphingobium chlorophenolicum]KEQ52038.1 hypothetical protein BV95_03722 [Sphingobium chlorophenolicum]